MKKIFYFFFLFSCFSGMLWLTAPIERNYNGLDVITTSPQPFIYQLVGFYQPKNFWQLLAWLFFAFLLAVLIFYFPKKEDLSQRISQETINKYREKK